MAKNTAFTSVFVTDTLIISCGTLGHYYAKPWKGLLGNIAPTGVSNWFNNDLIGSRTDLLQSFL